MAANKRQAEQFVREAVASVNKLARDRNIPQKDFILSIRVDVEDKITYHNHEDED